MKETKTIYTQEEAKNIVSDFIKETNSIRQERQDTFVKFEKFVIDGEQWYEDEKPEGDKPVLTFNQSEDHYFTYLAKLFPRNSETGTLAIGVKVEGEKKEEAEKEILETYKDNKLGSIVLEQAQNFFIGGTGCFYYPQDEISGKAKIISLDPTTVYLGWNGGQLSQFAFEDEISLADTNNTKQNWLISAITKLITGETEATRKFKKTKRITYWDNTCQIIAVGDDYKITKNENGFIPFSWIPNMPKAHRHEGIPETKKLYTLDKEFNQRASDFALRVKSNTKAVLAAFTDKDMSKIDEEEISGILPFGKDDRAEFLKLEENKELLDYLNLLSDRIGEKMAVNEAVKGAVKSNVSSLAMVYYFSPLMDRIGLKRIFWDEAFRELNKAILFYKFKSMEFKTEPIYEPVLLSDQSTKIDNVIKMIDSKLISHEDAIDQLRGSENAKVKVAEILEDVKKFEPVKDNSENQYITI